MSTKPRQYFSYDSLKAIRTSAGTLSTLGSEVLDLIDLAERDDLSDYNLTRSQMIHDQIRIIIDKSLSLHREFHSAIQKRTQLKYASRCYRDAVGRYLPSGTVTTIQKQTSLFMAGHRILFDTSIYYLRDGWITDGLSTVQEAATVSSRIFFQTAAEISLATAGYLPGEPLRRQSTWRRESVRKEIDRAAALMEQSVG